MAMRKAGLGWLCLGLLGAFAGARAGEAVDVAALEKQVTQLREQEREVWAKLREAEAKIRSVPDLVKLQEAETQASKAYAERLNADAALAAARKEENDARDALEKLVVATLDASEGAKGVRKELDDLEERRAELEFQQAIARLTLTHRSSPIARALEKDPELAKLREAAFDALRRGADREEREKARKAHDDARQAKLAAMPDAKKFLAEIEAADKEMAELRKTERDSIGKLMQIRRDIERGDAPDVKAAREKLDAARQAMAQAYGSEELKAARKPLEDARKAHSDKLRELMAADAGTAALMKQREALGEQLREAMRKIREARPKQE